MKLQPSPVPGTSRFVNLRHTPPGSRDGLSPVGNPAPRSLSSFRHLFSTAGSPRLEFIFNSLTLYVIEDGSRPRVVGELPSEPLCATQLSNDRFLINCVSGCVTVCRTDDSDYSIINPIGFLPDVTFATTDATTVEVAVEEVCLADSYDELHTTALSQRDTRRLGEAVNDARRRLGEAAAALNRLIHPVLIRYRLKDRNDATVFISPPVLVGTENQAIAFPLVYDHPGVTRWIPSARLQARCYGLELKTSADERLSHVTSLTVEVTAQLDPSQFYDIVRNRFARRSDGLFELQATMDCFLPGLGITEALVNEAVEHDEKLFRPVAVVNNPFSDGAQRVIAVANINGRDAVTTIGSPVVQCDVTARSLSVPHSMMATEVARVGDILLAANPAPVRFGGYGLRPFVASVGDGWWRAATSVRFDDGDCVVSVEEGDCRSPVTLTPLLSYPSADATEMTVTLQSSEGVFRRTFPLRPTISRRHSVYLDPSLKPISFVGHEAESFVIGAEKRSIRHLDGIAATISVDRPAEVISTRRISDSEIAAVLPAVGSSAGWDHVRGRFYTFSADGISVATVDSSRSLAAVATVDRRPVSNRQAVVSASSNGVIALSDDGSLLSLKGVSARLIDKTGGRRLAFYAARNELWIIGDENAGQVAVRSFDNGDYYLRRLPSPVVRVSDCVSSSVVETDGDLWLISDEDVSAPVDIEMTDRRDFSVVSPPGVRRRSGVNRLRSVTFDLDSPDRSRLSLELRRDHGPGIDMSLPVARFDIDGRVDSPLLFNVVGPVCQAVVVSVRGSALPSATIRSILIN